MGWSRDKASTCWTSRRNKKKREAITKMVRWCDSRWRALFRVRNRMVLQKAGMTWGSQDSSWSCALIYWLIEPHLQDAGVQCIHSCRMFCSGKLTLLNPTKCWSCFLNGGFASYRLCCVSRDVCVHPELQVFFNKSNCLMVRGVCSCRAIHNLHQYSNVGNCLLVMHFQSLDPSCNSTKCENKSTMSLYPWMIN